MLENLALIAAGVVILWIFGLFLYLRTSSQHHALQEDIESVRRLLDSDGSEEEPDHHSG